MTTSFAQIGATGAFLGIGVANQSVMGSTVPKTYLFSLILGYNTKPMRPFLRRTLILSFLVGAFVRPVSADPQYEIFDGGEEVIDITPWSRSIDFYGTNLSGQQICDFTMELVGCKGRAKFKRIKVIPRVERDRKGKITLEEGRYDWDVDDNMDGRSNGGYGGWATDADAPGGASERNG